MKLATRAFAIVLFLSSCGPQMGRALHSSTSACGLPSMSDFHGVHPTAIATTPLSAALLQRAPEGCAIVSFALDESGHAVSPAIVLERPGNKGIGDAAIELIVRDTYVPNSEAGFDTMAPTGADTKYAVTVGFTHMNGRLVVSRRTVQKHQTIRLGH